MTAPVCQESILDPQEETGANWVNLRSGIEGPSLPSSLPLPVLLGYLWFLGNRLRDDLLGVSSLWTLTVVIYKADTQDRVTSIELPRKPNQTKQEQQRSYVLLSKFTGLCWATLITILNQMQPRAMAGHTCS